MSEEEVQDESLDPKERHLGFDEDLSGIEIPTELPVLPLRGVVIFPSAIVPLLISRGSSLKVVDEAVPGDRTLAFLAQKNPEEESPGVDALHLRGTAGRILKILKYPDGSVRILVQGLRRIEVTEFTQTDPYLRARVQQLGDTPDSSDDLDAVQAHMVNQFSKFVSMIPYLPDELQVVAMNINPEFETIVMKMLAKNPEDRYSKPAELIVALEAISKSHRLEADAADWWVG